MSIAVNPRTSFEYCVVGVASGGFWRPSMMDDLDAVFDGEGSYSELGLVHIESMILRSCGWGRARAIRVAVFPMSMEF